MGEITALKKRLQDPGLLREEAFLAGKWVSGEAGSIPVDNPARGDIIANVADCSADQASRAISLAYEAQKLWAMRPAKDRADMLRRWFEEILANADDLATILTAEMGKPLAEARAEILYGASFMEFFSEEARRVSGETIPSPAPDKRTIILKQPVGVVGSITPWNFPNAMIARKVAPALAAGCSFVARPASETPLSALALAVLAERIGLPEGLLSVLPASDASTIGKVFCSDQKLRKLTFTGSTETGRILLRQAAEQVKKVSMELGGNAPFIVFDDADIDAAVEGAILCKFRNAGQTCVSANRIYVQDAVYDRFTEKLTQAASHLKLGDGLEDNIQIGPMISGNAIKKVEAHIIDAASKGAEIRLGGKAEGQWFQPTILSGMTSDMKSAREEVFGPVAPVFRFNTVEEVIELANDTIFGLASYFYARDLSRVWQVAEALEYGIVGVNTGIISDAAAPFGGVKQSGLGREGSHLGMEEFLETKYLSLQL